MGGFWFKRSVQPDSTSQTAGMEGTLSASSAETEALEQQVIHCYEALRPALRGYLIAFLSHPAEAEDLTQEVFLRLYRHLQQGGRVENVKLWAFRVAHNLAFNEQRKQRHQAWLDTTTWEEISASLRDPGLSPEQQLLRQEKWKRLHAGIAFLSAQERQCLLLRAEGFRYREIAETLGLESSTVGEYLQRAMRKLTASVNGGGDIH